MPKIKKMIISLKKYMVSTIKSDFMRRFMLGTMNMLSKAVKRDSKIVLCGAMNGRWFGDNSKYVYEWILENRPALKPVWLTNNDNDYKALKKAGKPVAKIRSIHGLLYLLRAEIGVFTNSLFDLSILPFLIPDHMKLIALRHGRSVKRIRFARKGHQISDDEAVERCRENELVVYVISTSDFISDIQEECLQIGRHKHVVTGYPRNDLLLNPGDDETVAWKKFIDGLEYEMVLLYAPSWRHGREATRFFPFDDFDAEHLLHYLEKQNVMMILRPHANDLEKYPDLVNFLTQIAGMSNNIVLATHAEIPDVNSLLPFVDALISDYSALYHDYLLLDRPMLFIPYDYDDFSERNGFLYDYKSMAPGVSIDSLANFKQEVDTLIYGGDRFKTERHQLLNLIHEYKDNNSRERVVNIIEEVIQN